MTFQTIHVSCFNATQRTVSWYSNTCHTRQILMLIWRHNNNNVPSLWESHCEKSHNSFQSFDVQQCQVAANRQWTKPTNLDCKHTRMLLESMPTIAIYYYYSAQKMILIYHPIEGIFSLCIFSSFSSASFDKNWKRHRTPNFMGPNSI